MVIDGISSAEAAVKSGVPQGTVLGPILFLAYINDLPELVKSNVRLFADDCLLHRPIRSSADQLCLQDDLDSLQDWALKSGFPTMPEMPATRPDEFYADQHVIGHIRLLSSW